VAKSMKMPKAGTIEIAPSILSADFARLADEIAAIESAGVNMVHLDVIASRKNLLIDYMSWVSLQGYA